MQKPNDPTQESFVSYIVEGENKQDSGEVGRMQKCWNCGAEYDLADNYRLVCDDQCAVEYRVLEANEWGCPIHGPNFRFKKHPNKDALNRRLDRT